MNLHFPKSPTKKIPLELLNASIIIMASQILPGGEGRKLDCLGHIYLSVKFNSEGEVPLYPSPLNLQHQNARQRKSVPFLLTELSAEPTFCVKVSKI